MAPDDLPVECRGEKIYGMLVRNTLKNDFRKPPKIVNIAKWSKSKNKPTANEINGFERMYLVTWA